MVTIPLFYLKKYYLYPFLKKIELWNYVIFNKNVYSYPIYLNMIRIEFRRLI